MVLAQAAGQGGKRFCLERVLGTPKKGNRAPGGRVKTQEWRRIWEQK